MCPIVANMYVDSSKVSYWARNGGGGDIWVLLCSQRGDTKNFFEKLIVFGVLARAVENAKNYRLFEKIFRVPPVANTVTPKCPPPPVACPIRHIFGKFLNFLTFFGRFGLFYMLVGQKHCCSSGCHFVISPGEPHQ